MHDNDPGLEEELAPSKTRIKKDMLALQELGEDLTSMPQSLLDKCPVPEKLLDAITEYKRLPNKQGARKRQLQYIGKIMRDIDPEPIQAVLDQEKQKAAFYKRKFQGIEQLRDELLTGSAEALTRLIATHPELNIQQLRQLIRQAQKEQSQDKPPMAARKLFKYLRENLKD